MVWTGSDLLQPRYYLSPGLTEDEVFEHVREFSRISPNWIVGDPSPIYLKLNERLRAKGIVRPLWSYFAMMQRLSGVPQVESLQSSDYDAIHYMKYSRS